MRSDSFLTLLQDIRRNGVRCNWTLAPTMPAPFSRGTMNHNAIYESNAQVTRQVRRGRMKVLALNAGSSSLKFKLFRLAAPDSPAAQPASDESEEVLDSGEVERTGTPAEAAEAALGRLLDAGQKIEAL